MKTTPKVAKGSTRTMPKTTTRTTTSTMTKAVAKLTLVAALGWLLAGCSKGPDESQAQNEPLALSSAVQTTQYTCPMHPHYQSDHDDGVCPICGMNLVPVGASADQEMEAAAVEVAAGMLQTMGVRTAPALVADFSRTLRAFGTVKSDERLENVNVSRLEGWIEDLRVRAEGDSVEPGSLLYRVYSPDLISAQKDFLHAQKAGNQSRLAAVTQRLRSLGMQDTAVAALTRSAAPLERIPVYAEAGGTVVALQIRQGDYIKPGTPIIRLQSYERVWVIANVPEQDLALIETGMAVNLQFPSAPAAPGTGRIDYVYPTIESTTRTGQVRIELNNPGGALRPGAYADISLKLDAQPRLSVPTEAVLRDSLGAHVIVALGNGRFAGRKVSTGVSANGLTEILSGLKPGTRVVSSGQFMLDSEVNLREGLSKLQGPADPHAGH